MRDRIKEWEVLRPPAPKEGDVLGLALGQSPTPGRQRCFWGHALYPRSYEGCHLVAGHYGPHQHRRRIMICKHRTYNGLPGWYPCNAVGSACPVINHDDGDEDRDPQ